MTPPSLTFLGTGEAFDPELQNTSLLYQGAATILFDCGFSTPQLLWQKNIDGDFLDAIYVSHLHADHVFGLPALFMRMQRAGRTRELVLAGPPGLKGYLEGLAAYAYPPGLSRFGFPIKWLTPEPGTPADCCGVRFEVAASEHGNIANLAVKVTDDEDGAGYSFCYSGDGRYTDETKRLYRDAPLLVHEAYYPPDKHVDGHDNVDRVLAMAQECGVATLALVHFQYECRAAIDRFLAQHSQKTVAILTPKPGDTVILQPQS